MDQVVAPQLAQPRLNALLLSAFAFAAVLLAAIGLYGIVASAVSQQTRELGVRLALGATPDRLRAMILRQAFTVAAVGALAGLLAALAGSRLLTTMLFEVTRRIRWRSSGHAAFSSRWHWLRPTSGSPGDEGRSDGGAEVRIVLREAPMHLAPSLSVYAAEAAQDLRVAMRRIRRAPALATAIVLTLGLGLGAAAAIFTASDAALVEPLPYAEPERLVHLWEVRAGTEERSPTSYPPSATGDRESGASVPWRATTPPTSRWRGRRGARPARRTRDPEFLPAAGSPDVGWS